MIKRTKKDKNNPCPNPFRSDSFLARYASSEKNGIAGWSSQVARQAHNLKVVGSNPAPATIFSPTKPVSVSRPLFFSFVPSGRIVTISHVTNDVRNAMLAHER